MQQGAPVSPDGLWVWDGAQWVPNPQRPQAANPWAAAYESASFRAMLTTIFLAANVVGVALFIVFDGLEMIHLQGGSADDSLFFAEGMVAVLSVLGYYGSFIPAVVFFSMWLHRVVRNMPALGSPDARWTPGGAVGRCFIPFMNLWHPLLSVIDAWRGSWPARRWVDVTARMSIPVPFLIVGWWSAWLGSRLVSVFSSALQRANGVQEQVVGAGVDVAANLLLVAAAILAILVVRQLTARQDAKDRLISSGQLV